MVIAGFVRDLGQVVALVTSMQIRAADAAVQHVDQQLAAPGNGRREVGDLQLPLRAADRPHVKSDLVGVQSLGERVIVEVKPALRHAASSVRLGRNGASPCLSK